jgi:hypothetical protein
MEKKVDRTTIPNTDYERSNKTEECGILQPFVLLGSIFKREIESRIFVAKTGFNNKKASFTCKK